MNQRKQAERSYRTAVSSVAGKLSSCANSEANSAIRRLYRLITAATGADLESLRLRQNVVPLGKEAPQSTLSDLLGHELYVKQGWLEERLTEGGSYYVVFEGVPLEMACYCGSSEAVFTAHQEAVLKFLDHYVFPFGWAKWFYAWSHELDQYGYP